MKPGPKWRDYFLWVLSFGGALQAHTLEPCNSNSTLLYAIRTNERVKGSMLIISPPSVLAIASNTNWFCSSEARLGICTQIGILAVLAIFLSMPGRHLLAMNVFKPILHALFSRSRSDSESTWWVGVLYPGRSTWGYKHPPLLSRTAKSTTAFHICCILLHTKFLWQQISLVSPSCRALLLDRR